ncbi:hypothetical protein Kisp02_57930 [Kineosporia sp. NBRC 101731]|nr:hypothetical protein Kisp02_57930 [Kineosporia sp. NBRC 101731]
MGGGLSLVLILGVLFVVALFAGFARTYLSEALMGECTRGRETAMGSIASWLAVSLADMEFGIAVNWFSSLSL